MPPSRGLPVIIVWLSEPFDAPFKVLPQELVLIGPVQTTSLTGGFVMPIRRTKRTAPSTIVFDAEKSLLVSYTPTFAKEPIFKYIKRT